MPLSSVLGASTLIKPGVVTSSTRPSVPYEGQLIYETDTDRIAAYNGAAWVTQNGLQLVKTQTIGTAVTSVTVTNAFSATYDNYLVTVSGGVGSGSTGGVMTLGSTTTGYYFAGTYVTYASTTVNGYRGSNVAGWFDVINVTTNLVDGYAIIRNPFLSKNTTITYGVAQSDTSSYTLQAGGYLANTTSYTDFTISWAPTTATGGTIRVYGYANS